MQMRWQDIFVLITTVLFISAQRNKAKSRCKVQSEWQFCEWGSVLCVPAWDKDLGNDIEQSASNVSNAMGMAT